MRLLLFMLLVAACGDDTSAQDDAAIDAAIDATIADAGAPDAFTPCPAPGPRAPFEGGFRDWLDTQNLASVKFTDTGSQRSSLSAPNGRIIVCLDRGGENRLETDGVDHLKLSHVTVADDSEELYRNASAIPLFLPTEAQADTFYSNLPLTRDAADTTLVLYVYSASTGDPLPGANVAPEQANDGSFQVSAGVGTLATETGSDGRLLFANVAADQNLTLTTPAGCSTPSTIAPEVGGLTSVLVLCN
jgi:hypothetical protein